jgi:hypothetical protein
VAAFVMAEIASPPFVFVPCLTSLRS